MKLSKRNQRIITNNKPRLDDYLHAQIIRLDIVSQLYKRGYSYREIREEVMKRLDLPTYSLRTVHKDVNRLLEEWRKTRIENTDLSVELELQRIDDLVKEAWAAWDKSKLDYEKKKNKQVGVPVPEKDDTGSGGITTVKMEKTSENVNSCGDPRYLELIHKLLIERRKLLGMYSPEKKEITGNLSFANLLMQTGMIEDAEVENE